MSNTDLRREFLAGTVMFLSNSYTLILIPSLVSSAGVPFTQVFIAMVLLTVVSSLIASRISGVPLIISTSVPLTGYVAYFLIQKNGIPVESSFGAVFYSGLLFLLLFLSGKIGELSKLIPEPLKKSIPAALGFLLAFLSFQGASGSALYVVLGGIAFGVVAMVVFPDFYLPLTLLFSLLLALLTGIHPSSSSILSASHGLASWRWDRFFFFWKGFPDVGYAISVVFLSLFFASFLDVTGTTWTIYSSLSREPDKKTSAVYGGIALGTMVGAFFGHPPLAVHAECLSGIHSGGRTPLATAFASLFFVLSFLLLPVLKLVPPVVTSPLLFLVGALLFKEVGRIELGDPEEFVPSFATIALVPLTMNLAAGIAGGFVVYTLMSLAKKKVPNVFVLLISFFSALYLLFGGVSYG